MSDENLSKLKTLVKNEKKNAVNPKKTNYSIDVRKGVIELTKYMSTNDISKELEISNSFIRRLKKRSSGTKVDNNTETTENSDLFKFVQMPDQLNNFMNENSPNTPAMRLSMPNGITIEIFS